MDLWIPITIAAALVQTLRFMLQKQLRSAGLSTSGAAFSRFVFGAPLALAVSAAAMIVLQAGPPRMGAGFWAFALLGGLCQIVATQLTVALLSLRNFAVGVAFTKSETVQVALFSAVLLGERISGWGWVAILVGLVGVGLLSTRAAGGGIVSRITVYGLLAGGLFGLSVICFRGATLALGEAPAALRAFVTLACVTSAQTVAMALWMRRVEPGELSRVFATWRRTVLVGIAGTLGSLFWFLAFALENAAHVRALGQIEMVFTLMISVLVFHERLTAREVAGMALICAGILLLVLTL